MDQIKNITQILFLFFTTVTYSQFGITGTVLDGDFNEPLPFANVLVKETGDGVTTDFDGKYTIELSSGNYTLIFFICRL
jgi:hypothetical protein